MIKSEIKPCPFCGSCNTATAQPQLITIVTCLNCGAKGPSNFYARWNDRYPEDLIRDQKAIAKARVVPV